MDVWMIEKGSSLILCFYLHHTKRTQKKRVTTCPMIDCSLQPYVNLVSGWVIFESNQGISWTPWYFKHLVQQDSISFSTFCQKRCGIKTITLCITNSLILESYFQVSNTNSDYRQGHFLTLSSSNVCRKAGTGLFPLLTLLILMLVALLEIRPCNYRRG